MMITDFLAMNGHGDEIEVDAYGHHVAFGCEACGHPVLAVTLQDQRGSNESHPVKCKGCGLRYFVEVRLAEKRLCVHTL